ncbi:FGGY-family carbohydrate kinase [Haloimpatiens sp. FM7330]|uniref:FGGY-family carbohydrate kinase n=1 Tax=Haloimpatiens sp. FM7330 TaxID=3298610 RepID=UPI003639D4BC
MRKYALSIDCGTQSVRALLFDNVGTLCAVEKVSFEPYFSKKPGFAEQYVDVFWNSACEACLKLKEAEIDKWKKISGISVTTQRDTVINVDRYGKPLRSAIIWLDQRMAKCEKKLPFIYNLELSLAGMSKSMKVVRKKVKANWIKENEPEIWNNTYKYLLLSGYFIYKLTGKFVDSIGSQIGHIPFDYRQRRWPKSHKNLKWYLFGIEEKKLPQLIEPGEVIGKVTKKAAEDMGLKEGTLVIASGSDKGCETLGNGCMNLDTISVSFGTTATVQTTSKKYFEPIRFMPCYPAAIPGYYNPEIEIFRGYWMISWFKKEFCSQEIYKSIEKNISTEDLLNDKLSGVPPGCNGLILQPYWGAGLKIPEARGAVIGFGDIHTKYHLYRSIIEGINYALYEGIERIQKKSKIPIRKVIAAGGGSQSNAICQITADMFNIKLLRVQTYETSGLGAAINVFVGTGVYKSYEEAVKNMVHYKNEFIPNDTNTQIYNEIYNRVYKRMYRSLRKMYKELQHITNYPEE